jgi:IrrE N-terminal-like domain
MTDQAVIRVAQRVSAKYELAPPVDIRTVLAKYAELNFAAYPFGKFDGISIHLKVPGKKSRVVVNSMNPSTRQRFTMAHELGHLLIPWHTGTIIDEVDSIESVSADGYLTMEDEANAFAAELLMPSQWISELIRFERNLAEVHRKTYECCEVSPLAAALNIAQKLPPNIMFAAVRDGLVEFSGRTKDTVARRPTNGEPLASDAYDYCEDHFSVASSPGRVFHWWKFPDEMNMTSIDNREWRDLLDQILLDIGIPSDAITKTKKSINGILGAANGSVKRNGPYTVPGIVSVCVQRMRDRAEFEQFTRHPLFDTFVLKRAQAFFA